MYYLSLVSHYKVYRKLPKHNSSALANRMFIQLIQSQAVNSLLGTMVYDNLVCFQLEIYSSDNPVYGVVLVSINNLLIVQ